MVLLVPVTIKKWKEISFLKQHYLLGLKIFLGYCFQCAQRSIGLDITHGWSHIGERHVPQLFYAWSFFNKYSYIYLTNYNCYVNILYNTLNTIFLKDEGFSSQVQLFTRFLFTRYWILFVQCIKRKKGSISEINISDNIPEWFHR